MSDNIDTFVVNRVTVIKVIFLVDVDGVGDFELGFLSQEKDVDNYVKPFAPSFAGETEQRVTL